MDQCSLYSYFPHPRHCISLLLLPTVVLLLNASNQSQTPNARASCQGWVVAKCEIRVGVKGQFSLWVPMGPYGERPIHQPVSPCGLLFRPQGLCPVLWMAQLVGRGAEAVLDRRTERSFGLLLCTRRTDSWRSTPTSKHPRRIP